MDLQTLHFFKTVADHGSFSAASHELKYAQSNISTKILRLENELQTTLFYRNNKGVTLTPKGKLFLDYTTEILHLLQTAKTEIKDNGEANGTLNIGSLETIAQVYLPELFSNYHKNNPKVRLSIRTGNTAELTKAVLDRTLDAAFISGPVEHQELKSKEYKREKLLLATATDKSSLQQLQNSTLLVFSYGCYYRYLLEKLLQDNKIVPKQVIEYDSIGAIIASLCAGGGISLLPYSVLSKYEDSKMIYTIEIEERYSLVDTYFIYRSDYHATTAFSHFKDSL